MDLTGDRVPRRAWVAGIAVATAVTGWLTYGWWERRALGAEARDRALPACTEKLGEEACRAHLALHHDDCVRLTFHGGGRRYSAARRSYVNQRSYQECVVLGVDEWVAENGRRAVRAEQERAKRPY